MKLFPPKYPRVTDFRAVGRRQAGTVREGVNLARGE